MKKILTIITILVLSLTLISCENNKEESQIRQFSSMYTTIIVEVFSDDENILDEIEDIFNLYNQISTKHRRNEVDSNNPYYNYENAYTINQNAGIKPVVVIDELIELVEYGILLHEETNGHFHIGIGHLADFWKEVIDNNIFITEVEYNILLTEAQKYNSIDIEKIIINKENKTIYLEDDTVELDLGALSKGYALNKAVELIKSKGIEKYKINAGMSSMAFGTHQDNRPFRVGIKDGNKKYNNDIVGILHIEHNTISTSGSSEQWVNVRDSEGKILNEKMITHIVSPFTLKPENYYHSVTLISKDAVLIDALSTAVYLMNPEEAVAFLNKLGIDYIIYLFDYSVLTNLSAEEFEKSNLK